MALDRFLVLEGGEPRIYEDFGYDGSLVGLRFCEPQAFPLRMEFQPEPPKLLGHACCKQRCHFRQRFVSPVLQVRPQLLDTRRMSLVMEVSLFGVLAHGLPAVHLFGVARLTPALPANGLQPIINSRCQPWPQLSWWIRGDV